MAEPFPLPARLVQSAYAKLDVVLSGDQDRIPALGPLERLDHPWEPARCGRALRAELWLWLDEVAAWVNHDYGWGVERLIPPCWPAHPHIAHELAVLADQRYSAGRAFHGGPLEEWHRYSLPLFLERMTTRLGSRCVNRHDEWPAVARFHSYTSPQSVTDRRARFDDDASTTSSTASTSRHLALVDLDTAEVIDDGGQP
jgi:hypothetical protein